MNNLEPKILWKYFLEICKIPRPSNKEEQIRTYLKKFGIDHKLETIEDETGNILIRKPATAKSKNLTPVILQSHMDMVCEKNNDITHDFDKDPIETYIDGDWIKAKGTTLGADNGIGCATSLAILVSEDIIHPDIECLFTVGEETGLNGAFGLKEGFLRGKMLINLDSEDDREIFIGCAGGIDTIAKMYYDNEDLEDKSLFTAYRIDIKGLKGGHSGDDINKGLGNSNKILNRILWNGQRITGLRISKFDGGNLRNAIPREAHAIVVIPQEDQKIFEDFISRARKTIASEIALQEPDFTLLLSKTDIPDAVISMDAQITLINTLYACPHGVLSMSFKMPGMVETSTNLASVKFKEDEIIEITTSQRSDSESMKRDISAMVESVFTLAGADVEHSDGYPGWTPNPDSALLKTTVEAYKKVTNKEPVVRSIHAGLECGLFLTKYPDMDMVSYGPTMLGVHSPDEKLSISSTQTYWKVILELLKNL